LRAFFFSYNPPFPPKVHRFPPSYALDFFFSPLRLLLVAFPRVVFSFFQRSRGFLIPPFSPHYIPPHRNVVSLFGARQRYFFLTESLSFLSPLFIRRRFFWSKIFPPAALFSPLGCSRANFHSWRPRFLRSIFRFKVPPLSPQWIASPASVSVSFMFL